MASDDAGENWTAPGDSGFANPNSAAGLFCLASGRLVLALNDDSQRRNRLSIALSPDFGCTWPFQRVVAEGESERSYPSVVQTSDGLIHLVYTEGRERIRHVELNEAWVVWGVMNEECKGRMQSAE
jgi:predicted neuraminidase